MRSFKSQGNVVKITSILFLVTLIFYLPIITNPSIFFYRGNDLQEFYWPIFYFIKENILQNHTVPLWNNMFFSGMPLLPDPGAMLFYPPNIIFLFFPIDQAFIVSLFLHTFFGGLGAYLAAKKGFGFSQISSIVTALLYITFPKAAGFLEAGHYGFIATIMWLPFLMLSTIKLIRSPKFGWSILFAISLSGLFFTFTTTFVVSVILSGLFVLGSYIKKRTPEILIFLFLGLIITGGLTAITLFPQIEWLPQSTRFVLLEDRDVYPKWNGKAEFIKSMYPHVFEGKNLINNLDSEKWLASGVFISILAIIGFVKLKKSLKILIIFTVFLTTLVSLNNASPIQSILLSSDWYVLSRVSTRVWLIVMLIIVFLAGFGLEYLRKKKLKKITFIIVTLAIGEMVIVSWFRLERPFLPQTKKISPALYEFLKRDPGNFRIFCVNRCLSQRDVANYNLQTIEGYGTIHQKNYYDQFIQLSQVFWDKYTSTLPPISIYEFREIQPYPPELADYNVKYVISPYQLKNPDFKLVGKFEKYFVFENTIVRARSYFIAKGSNSEIEAPIISYSPNKITVDTTKHKARELVLAEVWSPGWTAYLNGKEETPIQETLSALRQVEIKPDTQFVEFVYEPMSFKAGRKTTIISWILVLVYLTHVLTTKRLNPKKKLI